jgi:Family of unknown function (DUF5678)
MASIVKPETPSPRKSRVATTTRPLETEWLREHSEEYEGQWVAIVDDHLYSHGTNAVEVLQRARALGAKSPLIVRVPHGPELPSGGW